MQHETDQSKTGDEDLSEESDAPPHVSDSGKDSSSDSEECIFDKEFGYDPSQYVKTGTRGKIDPELSLDEFNPREVDATSWIDALPDYSPSIKPAVVVALLLIGVALLLGAAMIYLVGMDDPGGESGFQPELAVSEALPPQSLEGEDDSVAALPVQHIGDELVIIDDSVNDVETDAGVDAPLPDTSLQDDLKQEVARRPDDGDRAGRRTTQVARMPPIAPIDPDARGASSGGPRLIERVARGDSADGAGPYSEQPAPPPGSVSAGTSHTFAGIEFVWIPPGEFMMGSPDHEAGRDDSERPQHPVRIGQGFWMGKYEVTQGQWEEVMGGNPSAFKQIVGRGDRPVEQVSWNDCQAFIRRLNARGAGTFRLPTEAEWEYACRAGTTTPFSFGATITTSQANYNGNEVYGTGKRGDYLERTVTVGWYPANAWGLHEMHGNVWEWCEDGPGVYTSNARTDPVGPRTGQYRALRGGSWYTSPTYCRSAGRGRAATDFASASHGFRLVRMP